MRNVGRLVALQHDLVRTEGETIASRLASMPGGGGESGAS
jgi:hypothetical protein